MNLGEWIDQQIEYSPLPVTRRMVLEDLAKRSGVHFATLEPVTRGARMGLYQKAKAVAAATQFQVSILELCDETPGEMAQQIARVFRHG